MSFSRPLVQSSAPMRQADQPSTAAFDGVAAPSDFSSRVVAHQERSYAVVQLFRRSGASAETASAQKVQPSPICFQFKSPQPPQRIHNGVRVSDIPQISHPSTMGSFSSITSLSAEMAYRSRSPSVCVIRANPVSSLSRLANQGNPWAMTRLAMIYLRGQAGVPKDGQKAAILISRAAELGEKVAIALEQLAILDRQA